MGILDDLKQQADKARLDKEREEARQKELERIYQEELRPCMLKIHRYLLDLIEQLEQLSWSVKVSFDFPGIGRVDKLEQRNYNVSIDSQRDPRLIILRFDYVAAEEKRHTVTPKSAGDEACQFLLSQKIPFSDWALRDGNREITGLVIQARLGAKASIAFEADIENEGVRVISRHFEGVLDKSFLANYKGIDDGWLDQLGHYILRKNANFGKLDISEDELLRIRLLVEEERLRQLSVRQAPAEDPEAEDDDNGLLPKLRKIFTKPLL